MRARQFPRMKEVADRAGVSTATVSRVFSAPERVSGAVRQRVHAVAGELGYVINVAAQVLRRNNTGIVLVVVPDIGNPFFSKLLKGIEERARELSYSVLIGDTGKHAGMVERFARQIDAKRADGLILLNGQAPDFTGFRFSEGSGAETALWPIVVVSERIPGIRLPSVGIDNVHASEELVAHLIALGHRRIAHIAGPRGNVLTDERRAGYRAALRAAGISLDTGMIVSGDFSIISGRAAVRSLMARPALPTAIFASNDEMAMGAIAELRTLGFTVPNDISVAGFDDIEFAEIYDPPLTTVRQPRFEMGRTAMSMLADQLERKNVAAKEVVLPSALVLRRSSGPAR
jgi:LacI family repressor for deo operon, udp, cdd, tsx, nupC, and nupG